MFNSFEWPVGYPGLSQTGVDPPRLPDISDGAEVSASRGRSVTRETKKPKSKTIVYPEARKRATKPQTHDDAE